MFHIILCNYFRLRQYIYDVRGNSGIDLSKNAGTGDLARVVGRPVQLAWIVIACCRPLSRRLLSRRTCTLRGDCLRAHCYERTMAERHDLRCRGFNESTFLFRVADGVLAEITMTMDVSKSEPSKNGATQHECAGCGKAITER